MDKLRGKLARLTAQAVLEQDSGDFIDEPFDIPSEPLTVSYIDQGSTDFGVVADCILAMLKDEGVLKEDGDGRS